MEEVDQKMAGSGNSSGRQPDSDSGALQMLRWSTSLPGKNFRKLQKAFTKNLQIPSVPQRISLHLSSFLILIDHRMQTRYCVKWKSSEAKLVLKVTDNTTVSPPPLPLSPRPVHDLTCLLGSRNIQCIKFKTFSSAYLNRFEALNLTLMRKMQNRKRPDPSTSSIPAPADQGASSKAEGESLLPIQPAQGGGVKKKKAKKKK
jgi:signal recognition particle subunit SRP9